MEDRQQLAAWPYAYRMQPAPMVYYHGMQSPPMVPPLVPASHHHMVAGPGQFWPQGVSPAHMLPPQYHGPYGHHMMPAVAWVPASAVYANRTGPQQHHTPVPGTLHMVMAPPGQPPDGPLSPGKAAPAAPKVPPPPPPKVPPPAASKKLKRALKVTPSSSTTAAVSQAAAAPAAAAATAGLSPLTPKLPAVAPLAVLEPPAGSQDVQQQQQDKQPDQKVEVQQQGTTQLQQEARQHEPHQTACSPQQLVQPLERLQMGNSESDRQQRQHASSTANRAASAAAAASPAAAAAAAPAAAAAATCSSHVSQGVGPTPETQQGPALQQGTMQQGPQQQPTKGPPAALAQKLPWLFPPGAQQQQQQQQPSPVAAAAQKQPRQPAAVTTASPVQKGSSSSSGSRSSSSSSKSSYSAILARPQPVVVAGPSSTGSSSSGSGSSSHQLLSAQATHQSQAPTTDPLQDIQLRPLPTDADATKAMQAEFQFALFGRHAQYVISLLKPAAADKLRCLMRVSPSDLTLLMKQPNTEQLLDDIWEKHRGTSWEYVLGA